MHAELQLDNQICFRLYTTTSTMKDSSVGAEGHHGSWVYY